MDSHYLVTPRLRIHCLVFYLTVEFLYSLWTDLCFLLNFLWAVSREVVLRNSLRRIFTTTPLVIFGLLLTQYDESGSGNLRLGWLRTRSVALLHICAKVRTNAVPQVYLRFPTPSHSDYLLQSLGNDTFCSYCHSSLVILSLPITFSIFLYLTSSFTHVLPP